VHIERHFQVLRGIKLTETKKINKNIFCTNENKMKSCRPVIALLSIHTYRWVFEFQHFLTGFIYISISPDFDSVLFWFWNHETGRHSTSFRLLHWTGHQRRALHLMVESRLNFENQSSHLGKKRGVRGKAQHYGASAYILWNFWCGFVNQTIITK